jgi:hypothetical protein
MYWTLDQTTWSLGIKSRVCDAYDLSRSRFPRMKVTGIDVNSFEKFDVKQVIGPIPDGWPRVWGLGDPRQRESRCQAAHQGLHGA